MKIAIDCRLWDQGGVGRYIRNLVWHLEKIDQHHQYTLFFYQQEPKNISHRFQTQLTNAKWHSLSEQLLLAKELQQGAFDLVHFPYFSHPISYNQPFVITLHDLTVKHVATGKATTQWMPIYALKRYGYSLVLKHATKQAKHILVPSRSVETDLLTHFGEVKNKVSVTYEGLGLDLLQAKPKSVSLPTKQFWLYVGNFYPHKNVSLLLRALKELKEKSQTLVLVGPKDLFAQQVQQEINQLGITKQVVMLANLTNNELAWLYQHALGLVLPSLFEGFGLPVLEAAYFGCPLFLSDIAIFKEIAPKSSQFFNPHSVLSLKQQLLKVNKKQKLQTSSAYWQRFSFATMAKQTLAIYERNL